MVTPLNLILPKLSGLRKSAGGCVALCPSHEDRSPSLSIREGNDGRVLIHCHAGCSVESIVNSLGLEMKDLYPPNEISTPTKKQEVCAYDYVDEHGNALYQCVRYEPKSFNYRRLNPSGVFEYKLNGTRRVLYNLPNVLSAISRNEPIFIVEGEKDVHALREEFGVTATCNPMGAGKWRSEYSGSLRDAHCIIIPDNDEPGMSHAQHVARSLNGIAKSIKLLPLPNLPPKGDASDWIQIAKPALSGLLSLVESAPVFVLDQASTEKAASITEQSDRICQAKVAEAFLKENDVFVVNGIFYCYENGVWQPQKRRFVDRTIKKMCGMKATKHLIEGIKSLVSIDCAMESADLNSNRMLFNFRNGMFDVNSRKMLPHAKEHYSTIQFPFDFQQDATCPRWLKFIGEVLNDDEDLADLLQEIFGYILVPNSSMQKMFFFLGSGANGKGITIRILESLIDKNNRTCVDIRNLHNPFVRAAMHDKLLAVQGDFPKKFFGNEDILKTIVGGDTLDAQKKFKDQFEFTPFCRFIFAMNSLPATADTSEGFFRRVVVLPFKRVFTEEEQDRDLFEKLEVELPGIFQWALVGLQRLMERRCFSVSKEAQDALHRYKVDHNSVGLFIESDVIIHPDAKCKGASVFDQYRVFCEELGIEPIARNGFVRLLKTNCPFVVKTHRWGGDAEPARTYFGIGLRNS